MNRPTADGAHLSPADAAAIQNLTSPEANARELQRRYPGTLVWFGRYTREWWAYMPAGVSHRQPVNARLIEAKFVWELDQQLGRAWGLL